MKIIHLLGSGHVYSSNVYLILGEWKRIEDMSTLIDVGNDPDILHHLDLVHTGARKGNHLLCFITDKSDTLGQWSHLKPRDIC